MKREEIVSKEQEDDMEMSLAVGVPFRVHVHLDARDEGVELEIHEAMLFRKGIDGSLPHHISSLFSNRV